MPRVATSRVNALYYDPSTREVIDYHDGVKDLRRKRLRMIGEPETRYREDPVRMLRAVRFAAKLGFEIDEATREPIPRLAVLIENVPAGPPLRRDAEAADAADIRSPASRACAWRGCITACCRCST